jgi:hypothetical protein
MAGCAREESGNRRPRGGLRAFVVASELERRRLATRRRSKQEKE